MTSWTVQARSAMLASIVVSVYSACGGRDIPAACEAYLACTEEVAPETYSVNLATYGKGGSCWKSNIPDEDCEQACQIGVSGFHDAYPLSPRCDDGTGIDTTALLESRSEWTFDLSDGESECSPETLFQDMVIDFDPADEPGAVVAHGDIDWDSFGHRFDAPCTFLGTHLSCESVWDALYDDNLYYTLSGEFDYGFTRGTVTLAVEQYANDQFICESSTSGSGVSTGI